MEIIKLKELSFSYPNQERKALDNIDLTIEEGELVLVCGPSGGGKSTLLKQLKSELTPYGKKSGEIFYFGKNMKDYDLRTTASEIGYVLQNPEAQIVTDKVYHELAFGLENLGVDTQTIRRRVAEMSSFFGIQGWFRKNVVELSGGQKQLLNLAAIMVMEPKVLILDEPTSQLDPIAAKDFLDTLVRINRELSTTIIITEHNLEDIYPVADKVIVMEEGKVLTLGKPEEVAEVLCRGGEAHKMVKALPTPTRIYKDIQELFSSNEKDEIAVEKVQGIPLNVRSGKRWLRELFPEKVQVATLAKSRFQPDKEDIAIELKDVWFKYDKNLEPTLRNVSFKVHKGEFYSILGGNGTGKSTTLSVIANQRKALKGTVLINGINLKKFKGNTLYKDNLGVLPQNPQSLFVFETVKADLEEVFIFQKLEQEEIDKRVKAIAEKLDITYLLNQHPYDLSGGEIQKAALAKVLLLNPKILLLDEPTKGLDAYSKEVMGELILKLKEDGITILLVSHDIEFCARYSDRCAMFFDGGIVSEGNPVEFFRGNKFYTTVANRMTRDFFYDGITSEDVVELCRLNKSVI